MCICVWVCVREYRCLKSPEEGIRSSIADFTGRRGCWESNSDQNSVRAECTLNHPTIPPNYLASPQRGNY